MSDRDSFLGAIRANPEDDTLRLVFADWLDEHGEPERAEFVRVQVELERIREARGDSRVRELRERETELLAQHNAEWLGPIADIAEYPAFGPVFRRGVPEMVCLPLDVFLASHQDLFDACPTLRELCLFRINEGARFLHCPDLSRIHTLEVADIGYLMGQYGAGPLCQIITSGRVERLRIPAITTLHQLEMLGRAVVTGWPRWVEFLQYSPTVDPACVEGAAALDQIANRSVTRFVRPFENRFPLASNIGHGLYPGKNSDGDPSILAVRPDGSGLWVMFDEEGRQQDPATFGTITSAEVDAWRMWYAASISVREFDVRELSLRLWPQSLVHDYLQHPFERPAEVSWRGQNYGGAVRRWLHEGLFVIEWDGKEYWADSSGTIVGPR